MIKKLVLISLLATNYTIAAPSVSDPLGFYTINIPGKGALTQRLSIIGLQVANKIEYRGQVSSTSFASNTTTVNLSGILAASFSSPNKYYLEIISGTNEGVMYDIVSVSNGYVTFTGDIQNAFSGTPKVIIRKHHTIGSVFGIGENVKLLPGEDASQADTIQIFSSVTQSSTIYFYDSLDSMWVGAGQSGVDSQHTVLHPDQGIIIGRRGTADVNFQLVGNVKSGKTVLTCNPGYNVLTYPFPVETKVVSSGFYISQSSPNSMLGGESASEADEIQFYNVTNQTGTNYYFDTFETHWVQSGYSTDVTNTLKFEVGKSPMVIRKPNTGVALVVPQPYKRF